MPQPSPRRVALALALLLAGVIAGCASSGDSAMPVETTRPLMDCPIHFLDADPDTLARVIPLAFEQSHWGLQSLTHEITALQATAVTEDDRTVDLRAQQTADGQSTVQIRVGYFGDPSAESRFLQTLRDQLKHHAEKR